MPILSNGVARKIAIAVSFDERLESLLETGVALAMMTRSTLRLVHVAEPWTSSVLAPGIESGSEAMIRKLKSETRRIAKERLDELAASIPAELEVETTVLNGQVVSVIAHDARTHGVGVIIAGCRSRSVASLGCSTAVGLILEAEIPVMMVCDGVALRKRTAGLSILAADDLSQENRVVVDLAVSLATAASGSRLSHLHVVSSADLRTLGERVDRAPISSLEPERLDVALRAATEQMTRRLSSAAPLLEAQGCRYRQEIVCGVANREIDRAAAASRADIIIFGAHLMFHRDTRQSGQVPFKLMMTHNRPVVVVPQVVNASTLPK